MPRKDRQVWVLDLEYVQRPFKYMGGSAISESRRVVELPTPSTLVRWALKKERRICYAHCGSRADFPILLHYAARRGERARQGLYVSGGLIRFWLGLTEWRDSIKLLVAGVDKLGDAIGIKKAPLPYKDLASVSLKERIRASTNHALIVLECLEEFASRLGVDLCRLPLTSGAAAIKSLELHRGRKWPQLTGWSADLAHAAYFGARTEIEIKGVSEGVRSYDFNSKYPDVIESAPLPVGRPARVRGISRADLVVATVHVPVCDYPPLPVRHESWVVFPTGRISGIWPGKEIRSAVEHGARILNLDTAIRWRRRIDISDWVRKHYAWRAKGPDGKPLDPMGDLVAKRFLNSCYGKWGQHRPRDVVSGNPRKPRKAENLGAGYWRLRLEGVAPSWQNFACAMTVTGGGRADLLDLMYKAHPVILVDTDNVVTRAELETSDELGGLKLEWEGRVETLAPKVYKVETKGGKKWIKCKGAGTMTGHQFAHLRRGHQVRLEGLPTQLQIWDREELDMSSDRKYRLHLDVMKRCYAEDGTSRPWTMEEVLDGAMDRPLYSLGTLERLDAI